MRKSVKVILIIASSLVGMGVLCLCMSLAFGGINLVYKPSGSLNYKVMTATFDEVEAIDINGVSNDVRIVKSENDEVKVTYAISDNFGYYLKQIDNKLIIEYDDYREWFEFFGVFSFKDYDLLVEVPEKALENLSVNTISGDIEVKEIDALKTELESTSGDIEANVNAGELSASTTSGEINLSGELDGELNASSTSGDISLNSVSAKDANISATSGDITLKNSTFESAEADTMSGDVEFDKVTCTGDINIDTTSGEIKLEFVDAENYTVNSTSGEINAEILKGKIYNVRTVSGRIDTPQNVSTSSGYFNAETVSGNIDIEIAD